MGEIIQTGYVSETEDGLTLEKHQTLTVETLHEVLDVLINAGFGKYEVLVGYDDDCASTNVFNEFNIENNRIKFREL